MLQTVRATISAIARADSQVVEARATVYGETGERRVVAYPALTGSLAVGDSVLLNVTATALALGTGGYDFVSANLSRVAPTTLGDPDGTEHIIKLRYTPHQHAVRAVEMTPEYPAYWEQSRTPLRGTPVVVCELHSQIAAVCAGVKAANPEARIVYVYTDTAALPIAFSRLVPQLKEANLLDNTVTTGQAFGGDYEAVSIASALIAAVHVAGADVVVVGQGPGNAGTGTRYGWSGIEQGSQLDLAGMLDGTTIAAVRVSGGEARERHQGVSHHSLTVLGKIAQHTHLVAYPAEREWEQVSSDLELGEETIRHRLSAGASKPGLKLLAERDIRVTTMGRTADEDQPFFAFACAAGDLAARHIITPTPE
ncbi:MAG: DUF3866 family protein [Akkermansiaceae bacterium]|nr:DUF3866 family protein [Armatimonadota bacterium]